MLVLAACAHRAEPPRITQPSQVPCYGERTFERTVYLGSDREFHYFAWVHHLKSERVRVPRYALELPGEFVLGKGEAFVRHRADATLEVYGFKPARR